MRTAARHDTCLFLHSSTDGASLNLQMGNVHSSLSVCDEPPLKDARVEGRKCLDAPFRVVSSFISSFFHFSHSFAIHHVLTRVQSSLISFTVISSTVPPYCCPSCSTVSCVTLCVSNQYHRPNYHTAQRACRFDLDDGLLKHSTHSLACACTYHLGQSPSNSSSYYDDQTRTRPAPIDHARTSTPSCPARP